MAGLDPEVRRARVQLLRDLRRDQDPYSLSRGQVSRFVSEQPHTFGVVADQECVSVCADDTIPDHGNRPDGDVSVFA